MRKECFRRQKKDIFASVAIGAVGPLSLALAVPVTGVIGAPGIFTPILATGAVAYMAKNKRIKPASLTAGFAAGLFFAAATLLGSVGPTGGLDQISSAETTFGTEMAAAPDDMPYGGRRMNQAPAFLPFR